MQPKIACVDIETTGLDWLAQILTVAVSYRNEGGELCSKAWAIGMSDFFTPRSPVTVVRHELRTILQQADLVGGHNMTFDLSYLYRDQLLDPATVQGKLFDTMLMARMTGPYDSVSLENVAMKFGLSSPSWAKMKDKRKKLATLPPEMVLEYNAEDTKINLLLAEKLYAQAIQIYPDWYIRQESDFCDLMARIRVRGQAVNRPALERSIDEYRAKSNALIRTYLHPNKIDGPSHHQGVIRWLTGEGVKFTNFTPGGQPQVNEDSLKLLMVDAPERIQIIIQAVLDARECEKRLSTWLEPIYDHHATVDGRVHANFSVAGAFTYRLTANEPGVQAMPKALAIWDDFWSADYKQAELRVATMYAKDAKLASIFASGLDLHSASAAMMFGVDVDQVTKSQRSLAKTVNFASIYYSGPTTIAANAHIPLMLAKKTLTSHKKTFAPLYAAADRAIDVWKERKYMVLMHGKRVWLPDSEMDRIYKAFNNLIQGGVAELVGKAMRELDKRGYPLVGQTHDEIRFEPNYANFEQEEVRMVMRESMAEQIQSRTNPRIEMDVDIELVKQKDYVIA